jgi:hypothetical protein
MAAYQEWTGSDNDIYDEVFAMSIRQGHDRRRS